jgi:hypothetical protein
VWVSVDDWRVRASTSAANVRDEPLFAWHAGCSMEE